MTAERNVLLVGSMPFEDEAAAMAKAFELVGDAVWAVPDGEIGERTEACPGGTRSAWVQTIMDRCEADTENFEVVRPARRNAGGYAADYLSGPRVKPLHPPKRLSRHLDFGWADAARTSYPVFQRLRAEANRPDVKFQVGLPTGMGATFGMMRPPTALRYAAAFSERMATEANEILTFVDADDLVFQIEAPGELALAHKLPKGLAGLAAQRVVDLVTAIKPGPDIGVHLCFGDLNNEALIHASSLGKAVAFTNQLIRRWPRQHRLAYLHFPLAEAADPPSLDRSWYEPLGDIELPDDTRFVAGFVHDGRTDAELRVIRGHIESILGAEADVSCSCGLGRRDVETAELLMASCAALCHS